ncbi:MAG: DHA2 family efflux MFS transporter permease subunit [Acidiphilium sp.]|nr:DHA2 family efflux MFS transporter permease subunit [Acidiphilium sp.]MDD4935357.1 DHA2 family efflux MFS transporter permease subunit [Acidiphilium sp.]
MTIGLGLGLGLGSFAGGALQSIYPYVAGTLATSSDHALWTLTYFLVHWALGISLMPWFSRKFGLKRLFILAMITLAASCMLAIVATSLPIMLLARSVQGLSAGILVPLVQTLLLTHYPKRQQTLAVALWSNVMLVPFFLGPAFGGWLATNYSWLDIFWLVIPLSAVAIGLVQISLPNDRPSAPPPKFDIVGLMLLWPGMIALQIVLDQGEQFGWFRSVFISHVALIAAVLLVLFIIWELFEPVPLLQLRYLARRNFGFGLLLLCLGWSIFVGWSSILPLWSETDLGFNGWWGGVLLVPLAATAIPMAAMMSRLTRIFSLRALAVGCFVIYGGAYALAFFNPEVGLAATMPSELIQGIAVGMLFVPLTMIVLSDASPGEIAMASTTSNFIRVSSANLGVTLLSTLWERQTAHIEDNMRGDMPQDAVHEWASHMQAQGMSHDEVIALLAHMLHIQAETWSLDNALRLSAYICVGAAALALLLLRAPRSHLPKP